MTSNEEKDIEERIRALNDHGLLRLVAVEASRYQQRPESLEIGLKVAHDELRRRHIDVLNADQYFKRFPQERRSWKTTVRNMSFDFLLAAGAVGSLALPLVFLVVAVDKKWISEETSERLIRNGVIAFGLVVVLPAIGRARTIDPSKKELLGKEIVAGCVAFGFVALLALVTYLVKNTK